VEVDWRLLGEQSPGFLLFMVFLIALAESVAVVGVIVPGMMLLVALASAASWVNLSSVPLMIAAFFGAFLGDVSSFSLGAWGKQRFWRLNFVLKEPTWLVQGVSFFERWGWLSILIGRFVGPIRPVLPLVAGIFGMPRGQFLLIALVACLLWAPVVILPSYYFGQWVEALPPQLSTALIGMIVMLSLGLLSYSFFLKVTSQSVSYSYGLISAILVLIAGLSLVSVPSPELESWLRLQFQQFQLIEAMRFINPMDIAIGAVVLATAFSLLLQYRLGWPMASYWLAQMVLPLLILKGLGECLTALGFGPEFDFVAVGHTWLVTLAVVSISLWLPWQGGRVPRVWFLWGAFCTVIAAGSSWFYGLTPMLDLLFGLSMGAFQSILGLQGLHRIKKRWAVSSGEGFLEHNFVFYIITGCLLMIFLVVMVTNLLSHQG